MPYLRSGKNVVNEPIKKKKKQSIEEDKEEVKEVAIVEAVPEVSLEPEKEVTTALEEVKEVVTDVVTVLEEVKDTVKEVKEVEEFIEIKDVPVLNKKKGYGCTIC